MSTKETIIEKTKQKPNLLYKIKAERVTEPAMATALTVVELVFDGITAEIIVDILSQNY